jgi:hypothetical protein
MKLNESTWLGGTAALDFARIDDGWSRRLVSNLRILSDDASPLPSTILVTLGSSTKTLGSHMEWSRSQVVGTLMHILLNHLASSQKCSPIIYRSLRDFSHLTVY